MRNHQNLFEFLCMLIDVQIKKYLDLARIGVGPDAAMNATLVFDQADELMLFLGDLLDYLENKSGNKANDFQAIFYRIWFYLDLEYTRGYAGWLIDENPIHSPEFYRLQEQVSVLTQLGKRAGVDLNRPQIAETKLQKQSEYDSHAIAFLIVNTAIELKKNPQMELGDNIPAHAVRVFRKNATGPDGRYYRKDIFSEIERLHNKSKNFLDQCTLEKSKTGLSQTDAQAQSALHRNKLNEYLARYQIEAVKNSV